LPRQLVGGFFLLHSDTLTIEGSLVAIGTVAEVLVIVATCGVSVSAVSNNTVVSIAVVWLSLYDIGFVLSLLPASIPSPDRALAKLPDVLRGYYDSRVIGQLVLRQPGRLVHHFAGRHVSLFASRHVATGEVQGGPSCLPD